MGWLRLFDVTCFRSIMQCVEIIMQKKLQWAVFQLVTVLLHNNSNNNNIKLSCGWNVYIITYTKSFSHGMGYTINSLCSSCWQKAFYPILPCINQPSLDLHKMKVQWKALTVFLAFWWIYNVISHPRCSSR